MATKTVSQNSLAKDLFVLSRFNKYNPVFTTFAGSTFSFPWRPPSHQRESGSAKLTDENQTLVFSCLLAGSTLVGHGSDVTLTWVFRQTALTVAACYTFCGAGMVWNDWIDRDIDANVARTRDRPLASGKVTTAQAMIWMVAQMAASWWILYFMLEGKDM